MKDLKALLPTGLFGYRKDAVEDYVNRLESEIEIYEERTKKVDKQISNAAQDLDKALSQLRSRDSELSLLQSRNIALENEVRDLESQLRGLESQLNQANTRYEQLKKETETSEYSPKQIQDALLRAQKAGDSIVEDAQIKASELQAEAEELCRQKAQEGEAILCQAKADAEAVTTQLRRDCETIRQDIVGAKMSGVAYKRKMKSIMQELFDVLETIPELEESAGAAEETAEPVPGGLSK